MGNAPAARANYPTALKPKDIVAVDPIAIDWKWKVEKTNSTSPTAISTLVAREDLAHTLWAQQKRLGSTHGIQCFQCNGTGKVATPQPSDTNDAANDGASHAKVEVGVPPAQAQEARKQQKAEKEDVELPYDGDLQAAMRAQDRPAIVAIMKHRQKQKADAAAKIKTSGKEEEKEREVEKDTVEEEDYVKLPYDGDLQAAMRAQDRPAIVAIMKHRRKGAAPKAPEANAGNEVDEEEEEEEGGEMEGGVVGDSGREAESTGDAPRRRSCFGRLRWKCCGGEDDETRDAAPNAVWSYEDDKGWRVFPADVSSDLDRSAYEAKDRTSVSYPSPTKDQSQLRRVDTKDFSYDVDVGNMTFDVAKRVASPTGTQQPRAIRRILCQEDTVPSTAVPTMSAAAQNDATTCDHITWVYEYKGQDKITDSQEWHAFSEATSRRIESARERQSSQRSKVVKVPGAELSGSQLRSSNCPSFASGTYVNLDTMLITRRNGHSAPSEEALKVERIVWNKDPHASFMVDVAEMVGTADVRIEEAKGHRRLSSQLQGQLASLKKHEYGIVGGLAAAFGLVEAREAAVRGAAAVGLLSAEKKKGGEDCVENCGLCQGRGVVAKWLSSLAHDVAAAPSATCGICYGEGKYGLSVECEHIFCDDCIIGALNAALQAGQFPAFCPTCSAEAAQTATKCDTGRIDGTVLTFLYQAGVIDKTLRWRFMVETRRVAQETLEPFIPCPSYGCGSHIIVDESKVITRAVKKLGQSLEVHTSIGRCDCGARVCVVCKNKVNVVPHACSKAKASFDLRFNIEDDAALQQIKEEEDMRRFKAMKNMKPCPACGLLLEKNAGCDYMMCGDSAHGSISNAIRNGGCAFAFKWSSMKPLEADSVWDFDRKRRRFRVVTARQLPNHPKCARWGCKYYMTTDDVNIDHCGKPIEANLRKNQPWGRNEGKNYCCKSCRLFPTGGHSLFCHKVPFQEDGGSDESLVEEHKRKWREAKRAKFWNEFTGPCRFYVNGRIAVAISPLTPFVASKVRLIWAGQGLAPNLDDERVHAQFVGAPAYSKRRRRFLGGVFSSASLEGSKSTDGVLLEQMALKTTEGAYFAAEGAEEKALLVPELMTFIGPPPLHSRSDGSTIYLRTGLRVNAEDLLFGNVGLIPVTTKGYPYHESKAARRLSMILDRFYTFAVEATFSAPMQITGIKTNATAPFTVVALSEGEQSARNTPQWRRLTAGVDDSSLPKLMSAQNTKALTDIEEARRLELISEEELVTFLKNIDESEHAAAAGK